MKDKETIDKLRQEIQALKAEQRELKHASGKKGGSISRLKDKVARLQEDIQHYKFEYSRLKHREKEMRGMEIENRKLETEISLFKNGYYAT